MESIILETQALRKEFGALAVVRDISMQVMPNTIHAVIGPNGAGKTTLFNLLSGSISPTSGRVLFKGKDITNLQTHRTAHLGIGRSFQITNLFPDLTVLENIRLACQAMGKGNFQFFRHYKSFSEYEEQALSVAEQVGLSDKINLLAQTLSHGDQRKLELAMILATNSEVLLLDEPTAGMSAEQVPELISLIKQVHLEGERTILLVEHNMDVVLGVSDKISVMHHGSLLAEGTPAEIVENERVQNAYLGELYSETIALSQGLVQ